MLPFKHEWHYHTQQKMNYRVSDDIYEGGPGWLSDHMDICSRNISSALNGGCV